MELLFKGMNRLEVTRAMANAYNHPKMDRENRAKQFAPFAALTGFEAALKAKEAPPVNLDNQTIVPVIASFDKNGKMIPLYFSTNGIRIKINNIKWISKAMTWGMQFRCEITVQDHTETVDLCYYNTLRIWTLKTAQ